MRGMWQTDRGDMPDIAQINVICECRISLFQIQ